MSGARIFLPAFRRRKISTSGPPQITPRMNATAPTVSANGSPAPINNHSLPDLAAHVIDCAALSGQLIADGIVRDFEQNRQPLGELGKRRGSRLRSPVILRAIQLDQDDDLRIVSGEEA